MNVIDNVRFENVYKIKIKSCNIVFMIVQNIKLSKLMCILIVSLNCYIIYVK